MLSAVAGTLTLAACASSDPPAMPASSAMQPTAMTSLAAAEGVCTGSPALMSLWEKRMGQEGGQQAGQIQPLGPGDELRISVAGINQLQNEDVEVSDSGTIALPYAGTVDVAGLSVDQAEQALDQRFGEYIRTPEVHIVMEKNRSQAVAVMGLVSKPMLVPLTMPNETIMEVIGEAGGLTNDASQRILLFPGGAEAHAASPRIIEASADANAVPGAASMAARQDGGQGEAAPIVVDLHGGVDQSCLNLPMRAGDTILVPPAGNVMVGGWVERPGEVQITPGMTVLGAIESAGGALYSANVEILRANAEGRRARVPVDLAAVKSGKEPDPTVEAGDVVMVEGSAWGALPYAFHEVFTGLGSGIAIPIP